MSDSRLAKPANPARPTLDRLRQRKTEIEQIARQYGVGNVRVFGSVARGDSDVRSDVDLLVDLDPGRSLLDLGGFQFDAQELLGVAVDVATPEGLRSRLRDHILREAIAL